MAKKHTKKVKKQTWFVAVRGSYIPNSWQGWLTYVPFIIFLGVVMQSAVNASDSFSDVFYAIFPQWVAAAVVMTWLAKLKSK
jgi:hypothetical protein